MGDRGNEHCGAGSVRALIQLATFTLAFGAMACGGGEKPAPSSAAGPTTTGKAGSVPAIPVVGHPPAGATDQMVAEGDSIFHGRAQGGLCYVCHASDANGTPLGPSLLGHQWLTGSGSYDFIQQRVTNGMPKPSAPFLSPMPPKGGAPLTGNAVRAVSAYVYAISHAAGPG